MTGLGDNGLDLNFEDLEFTVDENLDEAEQEAAQNPEEEPEAQAPEGLEGGGEEAAEQTENNDTTTEGETPEIVGGGSAEEEEEDEQTSPQLYTTLANTLVEQGVLSSVDESSLKDVKDVEGFVDLMKAQIKAQEYNDLTDTQKEILDGVREGASNDTVTQFKTAMTQLDAITPEQITADEQVAKDLVYQDFLSKGFSKENAIKQVDRAVKLGVIAEDAAEAHVNLKAVVQERYTASKTADIAKRDSDDEQATKDAEALKKSILEGEKVMDLDIPEATRKEVYEDMMKHVSINPVTKAPENALMKYQRENPTEFSQKLYFLWKASKGFTNLDYFGNKKASSSVKDLERAIKQSTHISGGGDPSYSDDINASMLDIGDIVLPGEE